ncbi:hypothetical protein LOTGIDRAFT_158430 [Lottia gigantea]|uniref:Endoglucanase n=1 Tax=Lottia gigantea TaxID=225164 RepID=V4AWI1_LOTGI|nr:hypothetical protein LOTGIDRAFT_158430 [Lottia gigantea]ESO99345.1 hypothetical protein LOTGIDRAFT_158430 [Lottia gigantea]
MLSAIILALVANSLAQNVDVKMKLLQHWDNNFEGQFCYTLTHHIVGWEVIIKFDQPIKHIQQWEADWIEQPDDTKCITEAKLVNKNYKGVHDKGEQLCLKFMANTCGSGEPSATGTLVDLTNDHQTLPPLNVKPGAQKSKYNYADVLMKSILFYEAQRSGKLPANNRIPRRGDSALNDKGSNGEDLTGGWYDAGDNVKFNFPMAWSTTVLTWGLIQWKDAYENAGELDKITLWLILHWRVGDGGIDHGSWTSPERMTGNRPSFKIDASSPGSDVAMETAAAMAAGSIAFQTKDSAYSATLLTHAKQLYTFAKAHPSYYSNSVNAAAAYYKSENITDENSWGAIWLYKATSDKKYLADAEAAHIPGESWGFSWDEKIFRIILLEYNLKKKSNDKGVYLQDIKATMKAWMPGGSVPYTPKCLAFRLQWGALRYASNAAFLALVAADLGVNPDIYRKWAISQINYALGDTGRSFVIGFGVNPPKNPHHRGSSFPMIPAPCGWEEQQNKGPNPHTLYGALVGGPGSSDDYVDQRNDYIHNEVACDYNAGFQSAVAGLQHLANGQKLPTSYKTCS